MSLNFNIKTRAVEEGDLIFFLGFLFLTAETYMKGNCATSSLQHSTKICQIIIIWSSAQSPADISLLIAGYR